MKLGLLLLLLLLQLLLLKLKHGSPSRRTLLHARIRNRLRNHEAFLSDKHDPRHSVKAFCRICSTNFRLCFKCFVYVFGIGLISETSKQFRETILKGFLLWRLKRCTVKRPHVKGPHAKRPQWVRQNPSDLASATKGRRDKRPQKINEIS